MIREMRTSYLQKPRIKTGKLPGDLSPQEKRARKSFKQILRNKDKAALKRRTRKLIENDYDS